jgi:Skp family chaperone for outer membrane proteins
LHADWWLSMHRRQSDWSGSGLIAASDRTAELLRMDENAFAPGALIDYHQCFKSFQGATMKQIHTSILILAPILGLLWWKGQQPPAPQTAANIPPPAAATSAPVEQQPPAPQTAANIPVAKIAVIDSSDFSSDQGIQQLLQQRKLLDDKYRSRFDELQKLQREVDALQQEIRTKAANWTLEVQRRKQEDLEEKQLKGKRLSEDLQRDYQKELQRVTAPISERVRTHLQQYASRRGITLLMDLAPLNQAGAIPYIDQTIDVTQDFINDYNKAYPVTQTAGSPAPK